MAAPRVASQNSPDSEVEALEYSVFPECFERILRACRSESASRRLKRGNAHLVETYQEDERSNQYFFNKRKYLIFQHCLHLQVLFFGCG